VRARGTAPLAAPSDTFTSFREIPVAKSRNNLLGVGGQRKKLPRSEGQGTGPSTEDRRSAADHKQELLRKMRERAGQRPAQDSSEDEPENPQNP
jgi:hypothetical protein